MDEVTRSRFLKNFGKRLLKKRKEEKLTQAKLMAKIYGDNYEIGSNEKKLRNWEQGRHPTDIISLYALCEALDCDADYLLGRLDAPKHTVQEISDLTGLSYNFIQSLITHHAEYSNYREDFSGTDEKMHLDGTYNLFNIQYSDPRLSVLEYLYNERGLLKAIDSYVKTNTIHTVSINDSTFEIKDDTQIKINNFDIDVEITKENYLNIIRDKLNKVSLRFKNEE